METASRPMLVMSCSTGEAGLADRAQRQPVKAEHGHILWHPQALLLQRADDADGHQVAEAEHGVRKRISR